MKLPRIFQPDLNVGGQRSNLRTQQERILFNILRGMTFLGTALLAVYIISIGIPQQRWIGIGLFVGVYVLLLVATFIRRSPYAFRAGALLFIVFALGSYTTLIDGLHGNGRLYMIAFPIVTTILLGVRAGVVTMVISFLTLAITAFMMNQGYLPTPQLNIADVNTDLRTWALAATSYIAVAATTTISMASLLSSLGVSIQKEQTLSTEIEQERHQLEQNVTQRTKDLERRLVQIRTAAEITKTISTVLDQRTLLQQVVDLICDRFDLYYAGVFLVDERGEYAVLQAGTGFAGEQMVSEGHRLAVGGASMIGWTVSNRRARIALDVGAEAVRFNNPHLHLTRSELALPLISGERVIGAMTIQSSQPEAFDNDDITVLQGIADTVATAIENARLFERLEGSLEEIRSLHQQYLARSWTEAARLGGKMTHTYEGRHKSAAAEPARLEFPIALREQVIGNLVVESDRTDLTPDEIDLIHTVTTESAIAMENARLLTESQRSADREQLVTDVVSRVRTSTDVDAVLQTTIREIGRIMRASGGLIQLNVGFTEGRKEEENNGSHSEPQEMSQ